MKKKQSRPVHYFIAIIAVVAGVLFDQWTKLLVLTHLKGHNSYIVIKNVFELEYLENRGAAFGMLQGKQFFFIFCVFYVFYIVQATAKTAYACKQFTYCFVHYIFHLMHSLLILTRLKNDFYNFILNFHLIENIYMSY